ncbi:hypothetical protein [Escherichia coli]|uniref:hypothetical protein n=1 Tax=Escherichia coli TaxID=562 RepID=UPI004067E0FC
MAACVHWRFMHPIVLLLIQKNILERFQHMLRETDAREITDTVLINYRSMLSPATEWYLATIRGFLRSRHELGYPGISKEVNRLLDGWTLKGNRKGMRLSAWILKRGH